MDVPSLEEFVATTLHEIIAGVARAQSSAAQAGAVINPLGLHNSRSIQKIHFDIGVTATKGQNSGGGLKVGVVGVIDAKLKGGSDAQRTSENRVQFEVSVLFPVPPKRSQ